jgi:pimeloyl-ACP methyl ester carboxylesterase
MTLTASREGLAERIRRLEVPSLTVFGTADDHFADPGEEARKAVEELGGTSLMVEGAGHYPHVEQPETVAAAIRQFISELH